jgi:hypothetical protein
VMVMMRGWGLVHYLVLGVLGIAGLGGRGVVMVLFHACLLDGG